MSKMNLKFPISIFLIITITKSAVALNCTLCNSNDSPFCAQDPKSITAECTDGDGKCYTYIDNGITIRNCKGPDGECKEDDDTCKSCDSDYCNVDIYPAKRLSCIQCANTNDCVTMDAAAKGKYCMKYSKDDECYTYVESATAVQRGCLSDGFDKCTKDNCQTCKDNDDCNKNIESTTKFTCFECSSEKGNNECKRPVTSGEGECRISVTDKCTDLVLLGRKSECFINYDGNTVSRGCLSKKPTTGTTETFSEMDSNGKCIADVKCYICDSSKDSKCTDANSLGDSKECGAYTSACHLCENLAGNVTMRGCGLNSESDMICKTCLDNNCNKEAKLPKSCYSCDTKTNPKCADNENVETKFCKDSTDECYTMLDSDGMTKRGCKSELGENSCKADDPNCKICETHNCNTDKLVTELRQCYVCNNGDDCAKDQNQVSLNATNCLKADDMCYMFTADDKIMRRGCLSESDHPQECDKNDIKCLKCGTDGCNSKALLGPSGLKCIQCTGSDESCAWSFEAKNATPCTKTIAFYKQDVCYVLDDGSTNVERGCYSDSDVCTLENPNCRFCYDDGCNTQSSQKWSCVRCRSTFGGQEKCRNEKPSGFEKNCIKVPTVESKGCYTYNYDGVIVRGCLSDLDSIDYANCMNEKYRPCDACLEQNCNTRAPNSSSAAYMSTVLLVYSIVLVIIRF